MLTFLAVGVVGAGHACSDPVEVARDCLFVRGQHPQGVRQRLMRDKCATGMSPNSLRLARHNDETLKRFNKILKLCKKGKSLTKAELEKLGTKAMLYATSSRYAIKNNYNPT